MAQAKLQLETFSCFICRDLLKDPATIPCGNSFCMTCINSHWDREDDRHIYSCPQCRKTFTPRPVLERNPMLMTLVQEINKTRLQAGAAHHCSAGPRCVVAVAAERRMKQKKLNLRRKNIQKKVQGLEKELKQLQLEMQNLNCFADETVEKNGKKFSQLILLLEQRQQDVEQQIRSQQEAQVSRVKELQEQLEQEIVELKKKGSELEQLSLTQDLTHDVQHPHPSAEHL